MGMFSWECKGCSGELIESEEVRIQGFKGIYDGYGRVDSESGGSLDTEGTDMPCWHEKCYQAASNEEKIDMKPSAYAQNQGFGNPKKKFLPKKT